MFCVASTTEKNLTENSTLETETDGQKHNKGKKSDNEEEDVSGRPALQSPKRRKQLDTSESEPKSALCRQNFEFHETNVSLVTSAARCQISDESKDEELQEKTRKGRKTNKEEKNTPRLASLNSNLKEGSSSSSESIERVRLTFVSCCHRWFTRRCARW